MIIPTSYQKYRLKRILIINEIVSADYVFGVHPDTKPHVHNDAWELVFCQEGSVDVLRANEYLSLKPGMLTLIPPGVPHDSASLDPLSKALYIAFTFDMDYEAPLRQIVVQATPAQQAWMQSIIDELSSSFELNEGELRLFFFKPAPDTLIGVEQMVCCYLEQTLIGVLREVTKKDDHVITTSRFERAAENYLIEQVSSYIQNHISEDLSVENIARAFHYSRSRLTLMCKSVTGHSLNYLITNSRIMTAKKLLSEQKLTIAQIAEATGFSSPQYFSRRFHQIVKCTPSEFVSRYTTLDYSYEAESEAPLAAKGAGMACHD